MTSARFTYGGGHFCRQALPLAAYAHRTVRAATRSTGARVARAARLSREEHQGSPGKSAGPWAQEAEQENTHEGVAAAEAGVGVASYALGDSCCSLAQCATPLASFLGARTRASLLLIRGPAPSSPRAPRRARFTSRAACLRACGKVLALPLRTSRDYASGRRGGGHPARGLLARFTNACDLNRARGRDAAAHRASARRLACWRTDRHLRRRVAQLWRLQRNLERASA